MTFCTLGLLLAKNALLLMTSIFEEAEDYDYVSTTAPAQRPNGD